VVCCGRELSLERFQYGAVETAARCLVVGCVWTPGAETLFS